MRIIREFQQNFQGNTKSQFKFQFNRVYKQNPKNKLTIELATLASFNEDEPSPNPHLYFLKGIPQLTAITANVQDNDTTWSELFGGSDFFLGVLGGGINFVGSARGDTWIVTSPKIYCNEIPLEPFTIYYRHPNSLINQVNTNVEGVFFSFRITEYSDEEEE